VGDGGEGAGRGLGGGSGRPGGGGLRGGRDRAGRGLSAQVRRSRHAGRRRAGVAVPAQPVRTTPSTGREMSMQLVHAARALRAVTTREIVKFVEQRGRLLSALVRPLMWLAVVAAGDYKLVVLSLSPA